MSKLTKRLTVGTASLCLAAAGLVTGSVDANAIIRAPCNNDNVQIFNHDSPCFAYSGGMTVYLSRTAGAKGGINTGYVIRKSNGAKYNYGTGASSWPRAERFDVNAVHIW